MHHRQSLGRAALAAVLLSLLLVVAAAAPGAGGKSSEIAPQAVKSKSDSARAKLDKGLRALVEKGATKRVFVYATAKSDAAASAAALMRKGRYANAGDISLVVGSLRVPAGDEARRAARGHLGEAGPAEADSFSARDPRAQPEPGTFEVVPAVVHERPAAAGSAVLGRARPAGRQLRPPEAARRPRREDAQVRRRLEPGLRRRRHDRQHPRRRHRLGASRPPEHVADVVGRD